ncbi:MAG TPA: AI-2E family transporter, partial [Bdellovibrionota bacterium]|nr:AI-2E family transporter [Bdellovibrionota bacterium]
MAKKQPDSSLRADLLKLACLTLVLVAPAVVLWFAPELTTPALISVASTLILAPLVNVLERRGMSRATAILAVFSVLTAVAGVGGYWVASSVSSEWDSLQTKAPAYFNATVEKLRVIEATWKEKYPALQTFNPTDSLVAHGRDSGAWVVRHSPAMMGSLAMVFFIAPFLTFVLLKDGRSIRKRIFELVPNRFFESSFMVSSRIITSLSDYIQAKLVEALIVGLLTWAGLAIVGAPYALVLGIISGVTNIVPYLGPVFGLVPAVLVVAFDPTYASLFWPVIIVYTAANLIDNVLIFPVLVAKLVNLHPLVLIVAVMIGGQYYGMIGMLVSIPVATAL